MNIKLKKSKIQKSYQVNEFSLMYKSKYICFYKSHCHKINKYTKMKDAIEGMVKKGRLTKYTRYGKRVT